MKNLFEKDYSNERTISLWFMRLILSQYKSKNYSQNMTIMVIGAKIVILYERTCGTIQKIIYLSLSYLKRRKNKTKSRNTLFLNKEKKRLGLLTDYCLLTDFLSSFFPLKKFFTFEKKPATFFAKFCSFCDTPADSTNAGCNICQK